MIDKHIHKLFYLSIILTIIGTISFINRFIYNFWRYSMDNNGETIFTFIFLGLGFALNFMTLVVGGVQSYKRQHISVWWGFNLVTSITICAALYFILQLFIML